MKKKAVQQKSAEAVKKKELLIQKGKKVYKEKAIFKGNQYFAPLSIIDNEPKHNTQKIIAKELRNNYFLCITC